MQDTTSVDSMVSPQFQPPRLRIFFPVWVAANAAGFALALTITELWSFGFWLWGGIVSFVQWLVLRRRMTEAGCWSMSGCLSWIVAMFISAILIFLTRGIPLTPSSSTPPPQVLVEVVLLGSVLTGLFAGLLQWLLVSDLYECSGRWIVASVVGWLAPMAIVNLAAFLATRQPASLASQSPDFRILLGFGLAIGAISGTATGLPLATMLRHPKPPSSPQEPETDESWDEVKKQWAEAKRTWRGDRDPFMTRLDREYPTLPLQGITAIQLTLMQELNRREERDPHVKRDLLNVYDEMLERLDPERYLRGRVVLLAWYAKTMLELPGISDIEKYNGALSRLIEATALMPKETDRRAYAFAQKILGDVYLQHHSGNRENLLARAVECYQAALQVYTPEFSPLDHGDVLLALGDTYAVWPSGLGTENLKHALAQYQAALPHYPPNKAPLERAATLERIARCIRRLPDEYPGQRQEQAVRYLQEALTYLQVAERFAVDRKDTAPTPFAEVEERLGEVHQQLMLFEQDQSIVLSCAHYAKALTVWTPERSPTDCRRVAIRLADIYHTRGQWAEALAFYRMAIDAGEQLYRAGILTESKQFEVSSNIHSYIHAAYAAGRLGSPVEALLALDGGKTRLLTVALNMQITPPPDVPDNVWQAFEEAAKAARAAQLDRVFASFQMDTPLQAGTADETVARDANQALNAAIAAVQRYDSSFFGAAGRETIMAVLPDDTTALVTFCLTNDGGLALIACRRFSHLVATIDLPSMTTEWLQNLVMGNHQAGANSNGWWSLAQRSGEHPRATLHAELDRCLKLVGEHLLDPICVQLPAEVRRLILLPVGYLHLLPLHAVPLPSANQRRLCECYTISYAPSIQVLYNSLLKSDRRREMRLATVIDPDRSLRFAAMEGRRIAQLASDATIVEGRAATKADVLVSIRGQRYIHFACHGVYDQANPELSYLMCADGVLTLEDLQRGVVDLSTTRLVSLSACETALVDVFLGSSEEYIGLPAGFLLAGVPCIIGSLWPVDDLSSALLMERFYTNHIQRGMEIADALGEAQLWVRELSIGDVADYAAACFREAPERYRPIYLKYVHHYQHRATQNVHEQPFSHPYYWAAFAVHGL